MLLQRKNAVVRARYSDKDAQGMIAIKNRDTTGFGRTSFCGNKKVKDKAGVSGDYNGTGQGRKNRQASP
jgi:hypothetical protein